MDSKIIFLIVVALTLRLSILPLYGNHMIGDEIWNYHVAESFFSPDPLTTPTCMTKLEPQRVPCPISYRPLLYPTIIAPLKSITWMRLFNVLLGSLVIIPTFLIGKHYYGGLVGYTAALFVALHPPLIYASIQLTNRSLTILLVLYAIYAALTQKWRWFSLLSALSYLTNYTAIFLFLPAIFLLKKDRKKALLLFLLVISPWLVRNFLVFGDPLFTPAKYALTMHSWGEINTLSEPRGIGQYLQDLGGFPVGWVKAIGIRVLNPLLTYLPLTRAPNPLEFLLFFHGLGVFSPLVLLAAVIFAVRAFSRLEWNSLMSTIVFASATSPLLYGMLKAGGTVNEALLPLVPAYSILAAACVQGRPKFIFILLLSLLIQALLMVLLWAQGI